MATESTLWQLKDNRQEVQINIPSEKEIHSIEDKIKTKNLGEIQELVGPYLKFARKYRCYAIASNGQKYYPAVTEKPFNGLKMLKKDWVAFFALLHHYSNFMVFYQKEMSIAEKILFQKVLTQHFVSEEEAKLILGKEVTEKTDRYWSYTKQPKGKLKLWYVIETYQSTNVKHGYHSLGSYLVLKNISLYHELLPVIFKEMTENPVYKEIPNDDVDKLTTYSGEEFIFTALPILDSLFDAGQIEFGKSKVLVTAIKKAAKTLNMREFFPQGDKTSSILAITFLVNSYCLYYVTHAHKPSKKNPENLLKDMLLTNNHCDSILIPLLLPHLKGFMKSYMGNVSGRGLIYDLISTLKALKKQGWINVDQLCFATRTHSWQSENNFLLIDSYDFDKMLITNNYTQKNLYVSDIIREMTIPFIKSYLFMLASMGFVEVAYQEVTPQDKGTVSYFDGLKYVRLTNLGKYAIELTTKYVRTQQPDIQYFEADPHELIVKSLVENNPFDSILANMAERISKRMYKVSFESFLKDCNTKKDLENKISLFEEYVCQNPPAIWGGFFEIMLNRCHPMQKPKKKYLLMQIPPLNKALQRAVLSDPDIRKYCLKAEDCHLLVEQDNYKKVCDALKRYGYLM